jgi:hypothetical protein
VHIVKKINKFGTEEDIVCRRCHGWGFAQVPGVPGGTIVILCDGGDIDERPVEEVS